MRATKRFTMAVGCVLLAFWAGAQVPSARGAEQTYAGMWKGTWQGAGSSGSFDIVLTRGNDGAWSGSVAVGTDMGSYSAKFSKTEFTEDGKFSAAYDYPPDPMGEVTLTGTFEMKNASGAWNLGPKGSAGQWMAGGTWTITKQ